MAKSSNKSRKNINGPKKKVSLFGKAFIYFFIFILSLTFGTILLNKSFLFENDKVIKYSEKSNLDYKVYLKKNDFYEKEYLDKDMIYVAALIDKIAIDFDYKFESEIPQNIDFTYSVVANLKITNSTGTKSYFEKTYTVVEDKKININDKYGQIYEQVNIDYPYYNTLANSFKQQYGIDAESKITVYMIINKAGKEDSTVVLGSSNNMNIVIPLSERSVDIKLDYKDINETSSIIEKNKVTVKDFIPLVFAIILLLVALIHAIRLIRTLSKMIHKKSAYERYISKLLKEYDRLIAETSTLLSFEGKEIIYINKFTELLDIHDNLQLPIMYYPQSNNSSLFYISHEHVVYLLELNEEKIQ